MCSSNCTKSGNLPLFNSSFCSCFNMCRDKRTRLNYYFHDFSCTTIKFYDISGLENERLEFRLSRFSSLTSASPNEYLRIHSSKVCKCRDCIAHSVDIFTVASCDELINLLVKPLRRLPLKRSHYHYDNVTTLGHKSNVCAN